MGPLIIFQAQIDEDYLANAGVVFQGLKEDIVFHLRRNRHGQCLPVFLGQSGRWFCLKLPQWKTCLSPNTL